MTAAGPSILSIYGQSMAWLGEPTFKHLNKTAVALIILVHSLGYFRLCLQSSCLWVGTRAARLLSAYASQKATTNPSTNPYAHHRPDAFVPQREMKLTGATRSLGLMTVRIKLPPSREHRFYGKAFSLCLCVLSFNSIKSTAFHLLALMKCYPLPLSIP